MLLATVYAIILQGDTRIGTVLQKRVLEVEPQLYKFPRTWPTDGGA